MTVLDTSALIDSLTGARRSAPLLHRLIAEGERIILPALVLFEWLRGPRTKDELAIQEALFPSESSVAFTAQDAELSARIYRALPRPRGREIDIAIAACAINRGAAMWTLNEEDFKDIPGLQLRLP